jgi:hypothetical protein
VDLSGFFLTDNLYNKNQFTIPANTIIPSVGYILVWADKEPGQNSPESQVIHVNFALAAGGDSIGLFTPAGIEVDSVTFGIQTADVSQGRFPDGSETFEFMNAPSPRGPNTLGGGNTDPTLNPIPNSTILTSQTLSFMATATDSDTPPQTLTFSLLPGAPSGAGIHPGSGVFSWTPTEVQGGTTNAITVVVTDNGAPPRNAQRTFTVIVLVRQVDIIVSGGDISLSLPTIPGKTYRVSYTEHISPPPILWMPLGPDRVATGTSITIDDSIGENVQRFYKVDQLD